MEAIYTAILTFSTLLAVTVFMRLRQRLAPLFGIAALPIGPLVVLPVIAFLMVIAAPPPLLVGALLLTLFGWISDLRGLSAKWLLGVFVAAALLATTGLHVEALMKSVPVGIPPMLAPLGAWLCFMALLGGEVLVTGKLAESALSILLALTPLSLAPLASAVPVSVSLDAALIGSALLALLFAAREESLAGHALRWPLVLIMGLLILRTLASGGALFAAASTLIWLGCLFWRHADTVPEVTELMPPIDPRVKRPVTQRMTKRTPAKRNAYDF